MTEENEEDNLRFILLESAYEILKTHFPNDYMSFQSVINCNIVIFTHKSDTDGRAIRVRYVCRLKVRSSHVIRIDMMIQKMSTGRICGHITNRVKRAHNHASSELLHTTSATSHRTKRRSVKVGSLVTENKINNFNDQSFL